METIKLCCSYCNREFDKENRMTIDHIIPRSKLPWKIKPSQEMIVKNLHRGLKLCEFLSKDIENFVIACAECNNFKDSYSLFEFKQLLINIDFYKRTTKYKTISRRIPMDFNPNMVNLMISNINLLLTKNEFEELPVKYFNYE